MDDGNQTKICKGITKCVKENKITFQNYKDYLFNKTKQRNKMNTIRSKNHVMYTQTNKISLSHDDDKRKIREDNTHTYALGHFMTKSGGNSVSSGTT